MTASIADRFKAHAAPTIARLDDEGLVRAYQGARTLHASRTGPDRVEALLPMLALGDEIEARFGEDYLDDLMDATDAGRAAPPRAWTPDTARARVGGTFGT